MQILIECSPQSPKRGIGIYTENLINELAKIDDKNKYVIFSFFYKKYKQKIDLLPLPDKPNFRLHVEKIPERLVNFLEWELKLSFIEKFLIKERIDIYHSPGAKLPNLKKPKKIVTIHDTIPEIYPQWVSPKSLKFLREAVKKADKIIADSEKTKNDLTSLYKLNESKIKVIRPGVNRDVFRPIQDEDEFNTTCRKYKLPKKFILGLGPFNPNKNHTTLLRSFKKITEKIKDCYLVLVGKKELEYNKLLALTEKLNLKDKVIFTDYVPENDLARIYNLAEAFVFPSIYEGFGLPLLEAMACGCPVICSNSTSIPEVVGDSALLTSPLDADRLADLIYKVLNDENLRRSLKEKGLRQASKFSWRKAAEEVISVYEEVISTFSKI